MNAESRQQPLDGEVRLRPMDEDSFRRWSDHSITGFARELGLAEHLAPEETLRRARAEFARLLPEGRSTPGHDLMEALAGEAIVGLVWLGPHPRRPGAAGLYEIEVFEPFRGRGYGRAMLRSVDDLARSRGAGTVGLNVFGGNETAHRLYRAAGYRTVSMEMEKEVLPHGPAGT
jgi:ribosomal protein S18 acetylase RimI-like enzyme